MTYNIAYNIHIIHTFAEPQFSHQYIEPAIKWFMYPHCGCSHFHNISPSNLPPICPTSSAIGAGPTSPSLSCVFDSVKSSNVFPPSLPFGLSGNT